MTEEQSADIDEAIRDVEEIIDESKKLIASNERLIVAIKAYIITLLILLVFSTISHCQCIDTQYVAPSGKVVRVARADCECAVDTIYDRMLPRMILDTIPSSTRNAWIQPRLVRENCRKIITVTLTKGCPTCGSMKATEIGYHDGRSPESLFTVEWVRDFNHDDYYCVGKRAHCYACDDCGTVYRGRR
jgi:hypothetical protein